MLPGTAEARTQIRIGRYRITGRVGRGGMGMVYRGLDEALEREVALKTLITEGSFDSDSRKRFEVEAKAAARLQHPNIVIVYELGEDRGIPFIAMEMLAGADLEAVLRGQEPLCLAEKLDVVAQVCRGLGYAHERGIVHRDIKPSNIRLLDDGAAKIMDFGIAKLGGTHLTKTGMMVGTVHYMSPEQVRGRTLDGRSDVFSVGVILYELLAGERPFRGDGATQVLYKIVNEEPPEIDLAPLGPVGGRLREIVARALAKDPDARYPTATVLAEDLAAAFEEAQRAAGAPPADAVAALGDARRELREGRGARAAEALRALVREHPGFVEAHRVLRVAVREQKKRAAAKPLAASEAYPELEATFQATATRREAGTELQPTVVVGDDMAGETRALTGEPRSPVVPARRAWLWTGLGLVAVVALAAGVLLRRSPAPTELRLPVRSQPVGAAVLVDGRESGVTTNGELVLPVPAPAQVVLTFRKAGHLDETRTVRLPPAEGEVISVALQMAAPAWRLRSEPAGATVTLDGERVAGVTPLELELDAAVAHRLAVSLDGFAPQEVRIAKDQAPGPIEVTLPKLAPPGTVAVASSYALDVLWRGKPLAHGQVSPRVAVAGGRQVLTLVAPAVFLRADLEVNVPSGGEVALAAPALGRLNVRANPDNCEIFVNGVFLDYPPILDRPAAAGRLNVGFRWPDGVRAEQAIEVRPGAPAFVVGQKP